MIIYADTSFWLAAKFDADANRKKADVLIKRFDLDDWLWCDLNAVEFYCAVRAATVREAAPIPVPSARSMIFRMDRDVRQGQLLRKPLEWSASVAKTLELTAAHGWDRAHTPFDIWHIAAAWSLGADQFVTFDARQAALAREAGLSVPKP
jgi:predicted nucleic acid-binding protein